MSKDLKTILGFSTNSFYWFFSAFLILILIFFFFPWRFQVNDDVIMMWLISGAYTGTPEVYAVFIHPFLSYLLAKCYLISESYPWYPSLWFLSNLISFFLIEQCVSCSNLTKSWKVILKLFALLVVIHFSIFPQFTLVSGLLAFSSLSFLLNKSSKNHSFAELLAWIALALSMLIRIESFVLIAFGVFLFYLFSEIKEIKSVILIGKVALLAIILFGSKKIYENNSEFKSFLEFNKARHEVIDHPVFYEKYVSERDLFEDDWLYFSNWFFQESSITVEDLKLKKNELDEEYLSTASFYKSLKRYVSVQKTEMYKGFLSLTLIVVLLFYNLERKKVLIPLFIWGIFLIITNHVFHFRGRVIFLFYLVLLFPILLYELKAVSLRTSSLIKFLFFGVILYHGINVLAEANRRNLILRDFENLESLVTEDELLMMEGFPFEYFSDEFSRNNPVPFFLNGWVSRSPFQAAALQRFGFSNLKSTKSFSIIQMNDKEDYYTSEYLNSLGHKLELIETIESGDLILKRYKDFSF